MIQDIHTPNAQTAPAGKRPASANDNAKDAFDVSWILRDNRIHIEDQSHFLANNYLMIHPKELAPENQQRTFAKLVKHLAIPFPSFFEFYPRNAVMYTMANYLPISQQARGEALQEQLDKLAKQQQNGGVHPDGKELIERYTNPYNAAAKRFSQEPEMDAASREYLTQATALYLVINEALNLKKLPKEPASYVENVHSADGILSDITAKLGMKMSDFVQLAQQKGLDGIATRLGVSDQALAEIKQVAEEASKHHYADNVVINWELGRHIPGMDGRSVQDKIAVGLLQRAGGMMQGLRQQIPADAPAPEGTREAEQRVLAMLRELPKPLQEAIYYSGLELGFVSDTHLGNVRPAVRHAKGMNMFAPFEEGSSYGLRQIINSNFDQRGYSRKVLHHEVNHLFFPKQMGEQNIQTLESQIKADVTRLSALRTALDQWYIASDAEKPALEKHIDAQFKVGNIGLHEALSRESTNAIHPARLLDFVDDTLKNLDPDSTELVRGYPEPELRAAEIISRFSERLHQTLADHPSLLGFMCPQLMVGYHDIYLPHIERQNEQFKAEQKVLPPQLRNMGLPPEAAGLPQTQDAAMAQEQQIQPLTQAATSSPAPTPQNAIQTASIAAQAPAGAMRYLDKIQQMQGTSTLESDTSLQR